MTELYQSFLDASKDDYETAKINRKKSRDHISLYHYQQAFEKGLKALHIFRYKQIEGTNYSDENAYKKIREFSHNVEVSYVKFMTELANYEKLKFINDLNSTNDSNIKNIIQMAIKAVEGFTNSIPRMITRLDLKNKFQDNINNYEDWVGKRYADYQKNTDQINFSASDYNFSSFVSTSSLLYACLYNMDTITRYPDKSFNYNNLNILKDQDSACEMIDEMINDFLVLVNNFIANKV